MAGSLSQSAELKSAGGAWKLGMMVYVQEIDIVGNNKFRKVE